MIPVPKTEPHERRSEPRQKIGNAIVKLDPGDGQGPVACFVWDISEHGARLKLVQTIELPKVVHVLIGNIAKAATIVWRKDDQIGVEFFPE